MCPVMRALLLVVAIVALLAGCGGKEKQWYKPNADYTVAEFRKDRAACEVKGELDEDCLRKRGWVPLSADKEKPPPEIPTQRQRYF